MFAGRFNDAEGLCDAAVAFLLTLVCLPARARRTSAALGGGRVGRRSLCLSRPGQPDRVVGFEVDLKDALAKELGRPIQFKHYDFKNLIPGLQRGDFDFAMNGLEVLPEYQKVVLFSRPYYVYKLQLAVRKGEKRRFTTRRGVERPGIAGRRR